MKIMKNWEVFNEELTAKQKKLPEGLRKAIEKKQGGKKSKDEEDDKKKDDKDCKDKKGKDCKDDKKDEKEDKVDSSGLTAKQQKLPEGLKKAIIAKNKKKSNKK